MTQQHSDVAGSGRTDSGAHALQQTIAFSTDSELPAQVLQRAMNAVLPRDIAVISAHDVHGSFHPRYDATSRLYRYLIWNRTVRSPFWEGRAWHVKPPLDEVAMDQAAQLLAGTHDFSSFVPSVLAGSKVRSIYRTRCWREDSLVALEIEASGFMRQMVRAIVGTLVRVGRGSLQREGFREIVSAVSRQQGGETAPAYGLYLVDVRYGDAALKETPAWPHAANSTLNVQGPIRR